MFKTYAKKSINKFGYEILNFLLMNYVYISKNSFHF